VRIVLDDDVALAGSVETPPRARPSPKPGLKISMRSGSKVCEQIVDFFRGMNLRRKRIVYFVAGRARVEVSTEASERDVVVKDDAHSDEGSSDLDLTRGFAGKNKRSGPDVSARDGHCPAADARGRSHQSPSVSSAGNSW